MPKPLVAALGACVLSGAQVIGATSQVPVVFAVDTSRSLTRSDLAVSGRLLELLTDALGRDTPAAAVTFDDAAQWRAPIGTPLAGAVAALHGIEPAGHFTVLRDALYLAASRLDAGGVIVLVTDGRDENSAATVEDVAQRCGQRGVRIVAVPVGRLVDERALRRLALLTGGSYLGRNADTARVAQAVESARQAIGNRAAEAKPAAAPAPLPAPPTAVAPRGEPSARGAAVVLPAAVGAALVAALVAAVLLLRRRPATKACPRCGSVLAPWEIECSNCLIQEAQARQAAQKPVPLPLAEGVELPPEVFERTPLQEPLERTFALQDQQTITVREQEKLPRSYFLHPDEVFSVGRATKVNSLVLDDPTLSAQHFKIVPKDGDLFIVDLRTTNGTIVNGERVRAHRLHPGDLIRAGQVEFEYRVQDRRVT